jgi:uncharacterized membrane protein YhiD involved in acid resistance
MDELLKEAGKFKDFTTVFTVWDVLIAMVLSIVLAMIIAKIYKSTHHGISYSQSYVFTLILMATVVAMIMMIIGSNIARAFSLVGALSIIRFRNAVKETRDIGFMFFAMAIGMACGTKFYLMAVFGTLLISAFILIFFKLNLFAKEVRERILMVQIEKGIPYNTVFETVFKKFFDGVYLISIETVPEEKSLELVYNVSTKKGFDVEKFIDEIHALNNNRKVCLVEGQQQVDL